MIFASFIFSICQSSLFITRDSSVQVSFCENGFVASVIGASFSSEAVTL